MISVDDTERHEQDFGWDPGGHHLEIDCFDGKMLHSLPNAVQNHPVTLYTQ